MNRSVVRCVARVLAGGLSVALAACGSSASAPADRAADVIITNLPSPLWTMTEGVYEDAVSGDPITGWTIRDAP